MNVQVKICGLTTPETVEAALEAGADYLGFVFYPPSPRSLTPEQAGPLLARVAGRAKSVALLVDPDDALVAQVATLGPDLVQLHGGETPERVDAVRAVVGCPVIKAVPVETSEDLARARIYADSADHVMLDAKPPRDASRPGGHGAAFDWTLLGAGSPDDEAAGRAALGLGEGPWFLAGGLHPDNVAEAIRTTGAPAVDVSSGVEKAPGVKDPALIAAFIQAARNV